MHVRPCSSALHTYIHLDPRLTFSSFWSCYFCQEYISTKQNTAEYIWSLQFHDNVLYNYVGMWPAAMSGSTYNVGNQADWGGEVYSPVGQPSPPMGTGILPRPSGDSRYAAQSRQVGVSYPNTRQLYVNPKDTVLYASNPKFYSIMDRGYMNEYWGTHHFI